MRENTVKSQINNGRAALGVIAPNADPVIAEAIGLMGFDFYMIDGEHGAISSSEAQNIVRACEAVGITPLARIRSHDPKLILQFLDMGIMGIMMPSLESVDDVRRFVEAMYYPPLGKRGLGTVRVADYLLGPMIQAEYVRFANEQILVLPQIEDIAAVKGLREIVHVEGVDGFIIGPRDLAMSMGFYDGPNHDEVRAVIDDIFEIVLGAGLIIGTVAGNGEQARSLIQKGARIILGSVNGLLKSASSAFIDAARS